MLRWGLYVAETLLACLPFFLKKQRREKFHLRLAIALLLLAGVVFGAVFLIDWLMREFHYEDPIKITCTVGGYLILPALIFLVYKSLFDEPFASVLSSYVLGHAVRSMAFAFYILLISLVGRQHNFLTPDGATSFFNFVVYFSVNAFVYAIYLLIARRYIFKTDNTLPKGLLLVYVPVLILMLVVHGVGEIYNENDVTLYVLLLLSEITTYIVLFAADYLLRRNDQLRNENLLVTRLLEEQGRQFKFSKANSEDIRVKAHDLKHQVRVLREGGPEAEKLLTSLEGDIDTFESTIYLDNQVLNIVLREKWAYCKKHSIRLSYSGDPSAFNRLSPVELFTLTGNILDNAIEATMKLSDKSKRVISVSIHHRNGISSLRCDNFYEGEIKEDKGRYLTSKGDDLNHGLGIQSIKRIVSGYDGAVDIKASAGIYVIKVSIPDNE